MPTQEDTEETIDETKVKYDHTDTNFWYQELFADNSGGIDYHLPGTLTRDLHILLPARVYGYVLRSRKWRMYNLGPPTRHRTC